MDSMSGIHSFDRTAFDRKTLDGRSVDGQTGPLPPDPAADLAAQGAFWCRPRADRLGVIVDAAAYYQALRESMLRARRSIVIVGWDVDGRTPLGEPGRAPKDGLPLALREFLLALVDRNPHLHIHILLWDFTVLYSLDRELMPSLSFGWATPGRIHFGLDDAVPLGAAQHEKIVVVDGRLAFAGGLDIAQNRWDTPDHLVGDPRRRDADGVDYIPFHDVQVAVDGAAAAALCRHVRDRWHLACGRPMAPAPDAAATAAGDDPWPPSVPVDLRDVPVGLSRTLAPYDGRAGLQEVRALYTAAIGAARRSIYIENQYLTAAAVAEALLARLSRADAPEVVIVTPAADMGWLEEVTMGAGRTRFLDRLQGSGAWDKVRVLAPWIGGADDGHQDVKVHSKLMIVDDRLVTIGSANLANRSMGLDCEIALTVEATGGEAAAVTAFAAALRARLLGEHLGCGTAAVAEAMAQGASLIEVVDRLGDGRHDRGLKPLEPSAVAEAGSVEPLMRLGDPEQPIDLESLIRRQTATPLRLRRGAAVRRVLLAVLAVAVIAGLAAAWRFTPLGDLLEPERIEAWIGSIKNTPWAPLAVLGLYVGLGLIVFPVTVLIAGTGLVFGPGWGFAYALAGSLLSAAVAYVLGHALGKDLIRRYAGRRINKLSRRMGRHGVAAMVVLRVAPVAPFTVVNLMAGASHVRPMDFLAGTVVGMTPGIAAMTIFGTQLADLLSSPDATDLALLALIAVGWLGLSLLLQRLVVARRARRSRQEAT
jgi:phosphatidylserine/phosphatidylglycerophosphate/cardiolipin synthase-like enzyme/uncharacterized membrane protein YdjX (TVP38/TMEM64 family)